MFLYLEKEQSRTKSVSPSPAPRRTQRATAGVYSNPSRLPKSACNELSFSTDVLSQVLLI